MGDLNDYTEFECLEEYYEDVENEEFIEDKEEEEHEVKFFTTSHGGNKLSYDGYLYLRDKTVKNKDYFKCEKNQFGCKARITVENSENGNTNLFPSIKAHSHLARPLKSAAEISLSNLRENAVADSSRTCQVLIGFSAQTENRFINAMMPSKQALRHRVIRARKKNSEDLPTEPANIEFEYDRIFCSLNNEYVVLKDWIKTDGSQRVTIFSTSKLFNLLCDSEIWLCDGTFQTCPKLFYQLFIIHGNIAGDRYVAYPMLFALMSGKSGELYDIALELISQAARSYGKTFKFSHALFDFEKAIANAFVKRYPDANYTGCLFHYDQNIVKRLKAFGHYKRYLNDQSFHIEIACLMALAFIPADEILLFFEDLFPTLSTYAQEIAVWLKQNYIHREDGRIPRYQTCFWSVYTNFINGYPTTQNWAESYHHRIHAVLDAERQPIYKFIQFLKKEFTSILIDIDKYLCGKPQKHRMPNYERTENAMKVILNRRHNILRVETLKALVNVKDCLRP